MTGNRTSITYRPQSMTCGINRGAPERESSLCRRRTRLSSSSRVLLVIVVVVLLLLLSSSSSSSSSSYSSSSSSSYSSLSSSSTHGLAIFSREKGDFRESGRSSMATTANGDTRIAIDVATAVSRCPEYHLVDVGLRRSSPSTEHLSPLIASRSHASTHACTNGTQHSGSSLLDFRVVFPSFLSTSRSHLVTHGIRANEVPPFSLSASLSLTHTLSLPLSLFFFLSFSRVFRLPRRTIEHQLRRALYTMNDRNEGNERSLFPFFLLFLSLSLSFFFSRACTRSFHAKSLVAPRRLRRARRAAIFLLC